MKTKSIRRLDGQGRVILPVHIRKALNLSQDSLVTIEMTEDGEIRIKADEPRCCICGGSANLNEGVLFFSEEKLVCQRCVNIIKGGEK
jgi:bifunctional DNA-binding transcriptional regulator/antitoxin component of YhaV-PrlF toxin-antitoxin module